MLYEFQNQLKFYAYRKKADDDFTEHKISVTFESVFLKLIDILLSCFCFFVDIY